MTIRYINVALGTKSTINNVIATTVAHGASQANHVSIVYDDSTVTSQDQLIQGVRAALAAALSNRSLTV